MRSHITPIIRSFPVQLFLLHLKKNHFLLIFWVVLTGFISFRTGSRYGIPLLFLDPEYLGKVDFVSFAIAGFSFGAFFMVWNVTSYILHAHHFPFLATLNRPFGVYSLNNSIIPLAYFIVYTILLIQFQKREGLVDLSGIAFRYLGFLAGAVLFIALSMAYFFSTNKNIFQLLGLKDKEEPTEFNEDGPLWSVIPHRADIPVATYLNHRLQTKATRKVDHYPARVILRVYRQHHFNALFIQISSLFLIVLLGHLMEYPVFRIPTASSILLLFSIILMVIGAVSYWFKSWKVPVSIAAILLIELLISQDLLQYKNRPYGIDYTDGTSPYTQARLLELSSGNYVSQDSLVMTEILENWRAKHNPNDPAPKMLFINCSGGGLRASMFVMEALQHADSICGSNLMDHSMLITGASGGMLAGAYYRELYLRDKTSNEIKRYNKEYSDAMSADLLNPVAFSMVVNDLFFPWKEFRYDSVIYRKDRGYMFEQALNGNTGNVLDKPIEAYREAEYNSAIPLLLCYPTILNDARKLYVGTHSYSFLAYPNTRGYQHVTPEVDGVDIHHLLPDKRTGNLRLTSVLRMSCSFPLILPNVHLPTVPEIEVMDAGIRDNYGIESSVRFTSYFKDWIANNTSGVVMLNIRGLEQEVPIRTRISQGVFEKIVSPIGNLYLNWVEVQDYQNDYLLHQLKEELDVPLHVITVDYRPPPGRRRASLSFHLTAQEKEDIIYAVTDPYNLAAFRSLARLLQ